MYTKPMMTVYEFEDIAAIKVNASSITINVTCNGNSIGVVSCSAANSGAHDCSCGPGKSTCHGNHSSDP